MTEKDLFLFKLFLILAAWLELVNASGMHLIKKQKSSQIFVFYCCYCVILFYRALIAVRNSASSTWNLTQVKFAWCIRCVTCRRGPLTKTRRSFNLSRDCVGNARIPRPLIEASATLKKVLTTDGIEHTMNRATCKYLRKTIAHLRSHPIFMFM
jgi:hypothetical protein